MWFKKKPKNRRVGREHVLEVKLRSGQVKAARLRLAAISLGILFGTVFGLYVCWRTGEWLLNRFVYENPAFAIHKIEVQTDGVISPDQLRKWSGVKLGQNLLALDLERVCRYLEMESVIETASAERMMPHGLCLRITEREPIAQTSVSHRRNDGIVEQLPLYLDANGFVIVPLAANQRAAPLAPGEEKLPVLIGVTTTDLQPGRRIESPQTRAALDLIVAFSHSAMAGFVEIKQVDVSSPEVLVVTTDQNSEITFGMDDLDQRLRRWYAVYMRCKADTRAIATLDLAISNNLPLRYVEASAVPPSNPKTPKPLRSKKKHV